MFGAVIDTIQNPAEFRKFWISFAAAIVGVVGLFGVDVSATLETIGAFVLIALPLLVYVVSNKGQYDAPYLNKAVVNLVPALIGVLALVGIDGSATVDTIANAVLILIPLITRQVPNSD